MASRPVTDGAGVMLRALRSGQARTRSDLATHSGMARGTVGRRLDLLMEAGLVTLGETAESTGGRPSEIFRVNRNTGSLLVADVGATRARVAICDLLGTILSEHEGLLDVSNGPRQVLDELDTRWTRLRNEIDGDVPPLRGVGVSLPGPVDQAIGGTVSPPIMTGWDQFHVRDALANRYGCLAWVDNDVNAMAIGEHRDVLPEHRDMIFVKIGTGIGAGLIVNGELFRGSIGSAGDIGHIQMGGYDQRQCRCGMVGCVEAVAGGWALQQQLAERGITAHSSRDVVDLVRDGNPDAISLLRTAARVIGTALSYAVNLMNPSVLVIGGDLAHAREQMLAGIRETIYQRSLPLATANLQLTTSQLDRRAGVVGVAHLVADQILDPERIDTELAAMARSSR